MKKKLSLHVQEYIHGSLQNFYEKTSNLSHKSAGGGRFTAKRNKE